MEPALVVNNEETQVETSEAPTTLTEAIKVLGKAERSLAFAKKRVEKEELACLDAQDEIDRAKQNMRALLDQ